MVGDAAATRQQWNNREFPGDVLVRTNEARFDGTSITQGGYLNEAIAWRAVDNLGERALGQHHHSDSAAGSLRPERLHPGSIVQQNVRIPARAGLLGRRL